MPRRCTVCDHKDREAIDAALVAAEPFRHIASRHSVTTTALQRHKANHLPGHLAQAQEAEEIAQADDLLAQVQDLQRRALAILTKAERSGDLRVALQAIREARSNLELLARLLGELQEGQTVNVLVMPEWMTIRTVIVGALAPYPGARLAVVEALREVGDAGH